MTILVTGGAGFIGANFVFDWISGRDETVVNLDKLTYSGNPENLQRLKNNPLHVFVRGDICDASMLGALLARHKPRAIVNFAAESHVDRSIHGPRDFVDTNIVGVYTLLDSARAYWDDLAAAAKSEFRFLHVSTDEVYGSLEAGEPGFNENNAYRPNSPYSATKAASDHLVRAWHHTYGLPVLTTNCSNNYGPYQFPEKLIPLMIAKCLAGEALPVYGDGLQVRDWLYVSDHCAAIRRVLDAGRLGEVYNIGGDSERTNMSVVTTICDSVDRLRPRSDGSSRRDLITHITDRPGHDRRYAVDASKIAGELGWSPAESFETGLERTVRWYLDNQDWCDHVASGAYRDWLETNYSARA